MPRSNSKVGPGSKPPDSRPTLLLPYLPRKFRLLWDYIPVSEMDLWLMPAVYQAFLGNLIGVWRVKSSCTFRKSELGKIRGPSLLPIFWGDGYANKHHNCPRKRMFWVTFHTRASHGALLSKAWCWLCPEHPGKCCWGRPSSPALRFPWSVFTDQHYLKLISSHFGF